MERNLLGRKGRGGWEGGRESQAEETAHVQRHRGDEQRSLFMSWELSTTSCNHKALGCVGQGAGTVSYENGDGGLVALNVL